MSALESRLKALEEEVARLRALLPSPPPPPPSPPAAAVAITAPDEGAEVPLGDLTGYRVWLGLVCQAVAILGLWPFRPDGRMVLTREEASRVSSLVGAYLNNGLSWPKALEALGLTPPPVEAWLTNAHMSARRPPTRMRVSASFPPLPRSQKDGLEGGKIPGHLAPEERKEKAYPQDPPGIGAGGVPSVGRPLLAP
jgi:hypothetical protein